MKTKSLIAGTALAALLMGSSLWAASDISTTLAKESLSHWAETLPAGHDLTFDGIDYDTRTGLLKFKSLTYHWENAGGDSQTGDNGQISFRDLVIDSPTVQLLSGQGRPGTPTPVAKSIQWGSAKLSLNSEAFIANSVDGRLDDPALDISKDSPLPARLKSLRISHWQQHTLDYVAQYKTNQTPQMNKVRFRDSVLKNMSDGRIASFQATGSSYETTKSFSPQHSRQSEGKTGPISLRGLSFSPVEFSADMADHSILWSNDETLYADLSTLKAIFDASLRGGWQFETGRIEAITGNQYSEGSGHSSYSISRIDMHDIRPDSVGTVNAEQIKTQYKKALVSIDQVALSDWDLRALPGHLDEILMNGSKAFHENLSTKGVKAAIPAFTIGSFSFNGIKAISNKETGPDGKPLEVYHANKIGLSNVTFDGRDLMRLEADIVELSLPVETFDKSGATTFSEMMKNQYGMDRLPLYGRLHLSHSTQQQRLNLQEIMFGMGPLGEVSMNAEIIEFSIPISKEKAGLTAIFSKLAQADMQIRDKGLIDILLLLPNQQSPSPAPLRAEGRQLAEAALKTTSDARTREFLEAHIALLEKGGLLSMSARPAKPVTFAEIAAAANLPSPAFLISLLSMTTNYQN